MRFVLRLLSLCSRRRRVASCRPVLVSLSRLGIHTWKKRPLGLRLTDDQLAVLGELVLGDLEVEGRGAFPDAAGDVVVGAVAGAEPTAEVAGLADGDTTQMGADTCEEVCQWMSPCPEGSPPSPVSRGLTQHDEPLGLLDTLLVGLGVAQGGDVDLVGLIDLGLGAVADEDGLASPLDDDLDFASAWNVSGGDRPGLRVFAASTARIDRSGCNARSCPRG